MSLGYGEILVTGGKKRATEIHDDAWILDIYSQECRKVTTTTVIAKIKIGLEGSQLIVISLLNVL